MGETMRIIIEVPEATGAKTYTEPTVEGAVDAGGAPESLLGSEEPTPDSGVGGDSLEVIDAGGPPEELMEAVQEEPTDVEGEGDDSDAGPAPDPPMGSQEVEFYRNEAGAEQWRAAPREAESTGEV